MSNICVLRDRGVVKIFGPEASAFLHRLLTNSMQGIPAGESRYAALLTAQGKLLFDVFAVPLPEGGEPGYLLDCALDQAGEIVKRFNVIKLRTKITVEDCSLALGVAAIWDGPAPSGLEAAVYRDMRTPEMGLRLMAPREALAGIETATEADYEAHRVAQGAPKGGVDFAYGEAFPHDINLDWLNGVDFKKGCYVGQEVVSRVQFRNSARKRILKVHFEGPTPPPGTPVFAGDAQIGQVGSTAGSEGLAMLRLDRLEEAKAAGDVVKAGDVRIELDASKNLAEAGRF